MIQRHQHDWAHIDRLFDAALDLPEAERSRWLAETCGEDRGLRKEIEFLLELSESGDDRLKPRGALSGPFWEDVLQGLEHRLGTGPLTLGDHLGPYEIVGHLGRGGMGQVFRARDRVLEREVAIKALSNAFVGEPDNLRRFQQEAKFLASLNHPNIGSIYELCLAEGHPYLVLELVEGDTLSERLASGPLSVAETLSIAAQITDALESAHHKGIVHRDLKPSNIKLSADGRVKILDFGLAKSRSADAPAPDETREGDTAGAEKPPSPVTTRAGAIVGTPAYMSPEQARGQDVDPRADVWAFGCLLYEMLTGRRAFPGDAPFDVIAAVLRDPVDLSALPEELPDPVRGLIAQCLQKSADDRPQRIGEARPLLRTPQPSASGMWSMVARPEPGGLRRWLASTAIAGALWASLSLVVLAVIMLPSIGIGPGSETRIAVLPFENQGSAPNEEYLSDGLTEEMITELSRVAPDRLRVIARHTAMLYKGSDKSEREIGSELQVDYVVEGTLRRDGERLRITAHLVRVDDDATLWSESYDRELTDVIDLQSELALAIARRIRLTVDPDERKGRRPVPSGAYDAFLKARYNHSQGTVRATQRAIEQYRLAIERHPDFAEAHAGLARAYIFSTRIPPTMALREASAAAARALELNPDLPEARLANALVELYGHWDFPAAGREFEWALKLDPGNAETHFYHAHYLAAVDRLDQAIESCRKAARLDPGSSLIAHYIGRLRFFAGDDEGAIAEYERTLARDPTYPWAHLFLAVTYQGQDRHADAMRHRLEAWRLWGYSPRRLERVAELYRAEGYRAVLEARAEDVAWQTDKRGFVTSGEMAILQSQLGNREAALHWLDRALREHTRDMIYLHIEPAFDWLRDDPRFENLLIQHRFPPL